MNKPWSGNTARCREVMRRLGRMSKAEIARLTGLTATQVHDSINKMRKVGHARADGEVLGVRRRGPAAKYYVLVDKDKTALSPMERTESIHVTRPAGTWERRRPAAVRAGPFDGLGK